MVPIPSSLKNILAIYSEERELWMEFGLALKQRKKIESEKLTVTNLCS